MVELVLAFLTASYLGGREGWDRSGVVGAAALLWVPLYLVSCYVLPYRGCPWPWCSKRRATRGDRRGNYRRRPPCRVCGSRDYVRLGARLLGRR